jgi:hypothetical protein
MVVDDTGIEPVTPTMSMWCSTAEPIVQGILESYTNSSANNEAPISPASARNFAGWIVTSSRFPAYLRSLLKCARKGSQ